MAAPIVYHCDYAWLGGEKVEQNVRLSVRDGTIVSMTKPSSGQGLSEFNSGFRRDLGPGSGEIRLRGLTLPGLANTHSHVFHRAIRGHTQSGAGDFWQWRKMMYDAASRLTPETLYRLARATYTEMALAGIVSVGEFFYVHHQPGGSPYQDPNAMGLAVIRAARDAGIRITLLDTLYLQGGVGGEPLQGVQLRYSDRSWQQWAARVDALRSAVADDPMVRVGAAIHSVRAVPREAMAPVAQFCRSRAIPLHVHLSEQPAENDDCQQVFGLTPTQLLAAESVLSPSLTAVHATHLTDADIALLGKSKAAISMCPTTERDLADGVGPAIRLAVAGSPLAVGSDGHMMIDLLEEGRAIELNERLVTGKRGHLTPPQIAAALTTSGQRSIGFLADDASGGLSVGSAADMVTIRLDTVRTAGAMSADVLAHVLYSATASDVGDVIVKGESIVTDGAHRSTQTPGADLAAAIADCR